MELLDKKWQKVYPEPAKDSIMGMKADKTAMGCLKVLPPPSPCPQTRPKSQLIIHFDILFNYVPLTIECAQSYLS